ncbi:hypothetical protein C8A03DRAFT_46705 [Achaetomium macrosporum]|uniref:Rhodopsin domain-containing protein n=1 Tax=Achaetomium macrosporum TaxID=79813 RepID=A0AAN7H4U1_9PEZI|nr:hypothetical protein C8A03DRAFT_46705 [Achaetomium macrosporum]
MSSATSAPGPAPMGSATEPTAPGIPTHFRMGRVPRPGPHWRDIYADVLCIIAFRTRIYQRVLPAWKAGLDDYFTVLGFILTIADWAMLFPLMVPTPCLVPLDRSIEAGKNSWLAISVWGLCMTCIKISIALTLLRIQGKERGWRVFLYAVMSVQAVCGVGNALFNLAIACRPLEAAWNTFVPGARCVSVAVMRGVSNLGSSINITTDVLPSLAPATFLRKLNRPLRERVFVCVLMGMGLFASVSSIVKTVIATGVSICTWTVLEQLLGVLAACVPAMKGVVQRCLGAIGVSLTENKSHQRSEYYKRHGDNGVGVASRTGRNATSTLTSQKWDEFRSEQRFSLRGEELFEEETCIDRPDMSRPASTKSFGERSLDYGHGESRVHPIERLPAQAL